MVLFSHTVKNGDRDLRSRVRGWVVQWNDSFKSLKSVDIPPAAQLCLARIKPYWPLKKGTVDHPILLAWNTCGSCEDVVQGCVAFFLKAMAVHMGEEDAAAHAGHRLFCQDKVQLLFWEDVRPYYISHDYQREPEGADVKEGGRWKSRAQFVQDLLVTNGMVILCLEDHGFRLRSGSNPDLCAFELFIEDLILAGNGLVAFSRQTLLYRPEDTENGFMRKEGYRISFKISRDFLKTSLEETMEPKAHLLRSVQFVEPVKPGCFDRLLQLLALGQDFVSGVETMWKPFCEAGVQKKFKK
jgi:hypothetical protein